ncbi:6-phosphogluconolactonase [Antarcticimicrobium luteum]|uniref:6-phosphogluconolactonase n=1 Tax=Antarcticimicrobium luteum TaxID=2547397 RepID=A0A4R5VE80_9RHOB|nr:6-phosphogluconolactonase [Antarcticimicrobium luteum]TDK50699.1 6-phosphogluconolactonase [Antarcticimicrobium luteum]
MNFVDYPDREMLAIDLANCLAGELESYLLRHETVSFAVPGGTSPGAVFDALCAADLDWDRVHVFPTDERWVPADHPRSNARMICERLITNRAASARFLPLSAPGNAPEEVLAAIEAMLLPELPISVLLLGMGTDMHVASLFPGAEGLQAALDPDAPVLTALRPETVPEPRISLSARVLDGALSKHLVIFGEEKRAALDRAMTLPPEEAPVQAILTGTTVHWAN